jgi:hypothetical protein
MRRSSWHSADHLHYCYQTVILLNREWESQRKIKVDFLYVAGSLLNRVCFEIRAIGVKLGRYRSLYSPWLAFSSVGEYNGPRLPSLLLSFSRRLSSEPAEIKQAQQSYLSRAAFKGDPMGAQ